MTSVESLIDAKLHRLGDLSNDDRGRLEGLLSGRRRAAAGEALVEEGSRPTFSTLLLSGFVGRVSTLADGGRQITAISIPGDFIDLHGFLLKTMDHSLVALSDVTVAVVQHADLKRVTEHAPRLARALWLETLIDAAIHRQWLVALGRRDAGTRLGQLICELYLRLEAVALAHDHTFQCPLTQSDLADMLGMSSVHVNRSLKVLRDTGLVRWRNGQVWIDDWTALTERVAFDASYLDLKLSRSSSGVPIARRRTA